MTHRGTLRTKWALPDGDEITIDVDYLYQRGRKERAPSLEHPGAPSEADLIEVGEVRTVPPGARHGRPVPPWLSKIVADSGRIYAECVIDARGLVL